MADTKTAPISKPTNDILGQVVERVKAGDNVLIALSASPNVDEMAAAVGLTLTLDKLGKHATAIFSGQVPNALEFLKPENTFEANTDSLQDFIIALNKEKADHLRYKIEGDFVKIFITPYRTTISEEDLEFSHGDFNVDLVVALNVATPADLDRALSEHGRIMHNASSVNITAGVPGKFGDMEWNNPAASSVSEMVGMLLGRLEDGKTELLDTQVATAILTGIVAATNRFSNEKTTPDTMVMASRLMSKGADQQLISSNIPVDLKVVNMEGGGTAKEVAPAGDASVLSVERAETQPAELPVMQGAVEFAPVTDPAVAPAPTAEQELEGIVQPPVAAGGPLMDELRQVASDDVAVGDLRDNAPKKDYGALIEQELRTPVGEEVGGEPVAVAEQSVPTPEVPVASEVVAPVSETVAPVGNLAVQAAPAVASSPEINGVPVINYAQVPVDNPVMAAPTGGGDMTVAAPVVNDAVAPVVPPAAEPVASPLPMPTGGALPPPPPPFDPSAGLVVPTPVETVPPALVIPAPAAAPEPVAQAQPVMPDVVPIAPAAPEEDHTYLGSNPAMADQVYPQDPGAFQLPQ